MASVTNTKEFIKLLKVHPELWRRHTRFGVSNWERRHKVFESLSQITGSTVEECQKRVKNLKDQMRKCVIKLPKKDDGTPDFGMADHLISWPYFQDLLFMKNEFCRGQRKTQDLEDQKSGEEFDDILVYKVEEEDTDETAIDDLPVTMEPPQTKPLMVVDVMGAEESRKRHSDSTETNLEQKKLRTIRQILEHHGETSDDWDDFTKDIGNDLRHIRDPLLKIEAKSNIRRIVEQFVIRQLQQDMVP